MRVNSKKNSEDGKVVHGGLDFRKESDMENMTSVQKKQKRLSGRRPVGRN